MAPKGTGDDRVLSHKKVIQNMLAAAEERITQAVARRAAQVGAQSSAPGTGTGTPAGAGATETGRIGGGTTFPAVMMEPPNVRFGTIEVLYEDTHAKLHQKLRTTFGKPDSHLQVIAAADGQNHQILDSSLRIRDLPYLVIGREVQTVQLAVSIDLTRPPPRTGASPPTRRDGPGTPGPGGAGTDGTDGPQDTRGAAPHPHGGSGDSRDSGNASGQGARQHKDIEGSDISHQEQRESTSTNDQQGMEWEYPKDGMHFRVMMSAKTDATTRLVDEATRWIAPHTLFEDIHDHARRLFHVSDIPTTATWEVHGDQPNPYKPWVIGQKDGLQAQQLPTIFSMQDRAGLVLHLRCD